MTMWKPKEKPLKYWTTKATIRCPYCGQVIKDGRKYCTLCAKGWSK